MNITSGIQISENNLILFLDFKYVSFWVPINPTVGHNFEFSL